MPTFPTSLPAPALNSLTETPPKNTIRSETDKGIPRLRRRTTAAIRPISFILKLTPAQIQVLDNFYVNDVFSGAIEFDYTHPRTGAACKAIFMEEPNYSEKEGVMYEASISLGIMP